MIESNRRGDGPSESYMEVREFVTEGNGSGEPPPTAPYNGFRYGPELVGHLIWSLA